MIVLIGWKWMVGRSVDGKLERPVVILRACLVHCNDYYMGIGISITRNTLSWNIISITIH